MRSRLSHLLLLGVSGVVLVIATRASGQAPDAEAKAIALFEEGRKFVESGDCAAAVPKLTESIKHQPSIGSRLSLAECYEKADPLAAWRENKLAERLGLKKGDDRATYARSKAAALEPRLALLRVVIPASRIDLPGLAVSVDGVAVDSFSYRDSPVMAVTPGLHRVDVSAPRKTAWSQEVRATVGSIVLANVRLEETSPEPVASLPPALEGASQRSAGLIVGAVGVVGLVAGSVAGIVALDKKASLTSTCEKNGGSFPSPCGGGQLSAAERSVVSSDQGALQAWSAVSTVGFIAGGALLATGVTLYLTAPTGARTVAVRVSPAEAALVGQW
jgi:hypothetical protein